MGATEMTRLAGSTSASSIKLTERENRLMQARSKSLMSADSRSNLLTASGSSETVQWVGDPPHEGPTIEEHKTPADQPLNGDGK